MDGEPMRVRSRSPHREGGVDESVLRAQQLAAGIDVTAGMGGADGSIQQRMVSIPQECVGKVLGKQGETIIGLRAKHMCEIALDQSTRDKGYSICTITGANDVHVSQAQEEVETIMLEYQAFLLQQKENEQEIQVPQKYVGLVIGSGGTTIQKIKNETKAEISMCQDTKEMGYSVAKVSGSVDSVAHAVEIISKMIDSGQQSGQQTEAYKMAIGTIATDSGAAARIPFDKIQGLEFLEKAKGLSSKPQALKDGEFALALESGSFDGGQTVSDTFEVPKKYLGLLIGKGGEAIRKMRDVATTKGVKIFIDQDNAESAGVVKVQGANWNSIQETKASLQQNLFKAISNIENQHGNVTNMATKGKAAVANGGKSKSPTKGGKWWGGGGDDASWWADVFGSMMTKNGGGGQSPNSWGASGGSNWGSTNWGASGGWNSGSDWTGSSAAGGGSNSDDWMSSLLGGSNSTSGGNTPTAAVSNGNGGDKMAEALASLLGGGGGTW